MLELSLYTSYKKYLKTGEMRTCFLLGNYANVDYTGEAILTYGFTEQAKVEIGKININRISFMRIQDLTEEEFKWQSPDCKSIELVCLCLSNIYRKVVIPGDYISVISWEPQYSLESHNSDSHSSEPKKIVRNLG